MFDSSHWPDLRAGLLALVLISQVLLGLPKPTPLTEATFQRPAAKVELRGWTEGLAGLGLPVTEDLVADYAIRISQDLGSFSRGASAPFKWPKRLFGINQNWALFAAPDTIPSRLYLDVQTAGGSWQPVYIPHHADHTVLRGTLRFRRVRGVHDGLTTRSRVQQAMVDWLCRRVLERNPSWEAARVRILQRATPMPGQPAPKRERLRLDEMRTRAEVGL